MLYLSSIFRRLAHARHRGSSPSDISPSIDAAGADVTRLADNGVIDNRHTTARE
jgi:hypothetical protein